MYSDFNVFVTTRRQLSYPFYAATFSIARRQFFDYSNKGLIIYMYFSHYFRNVLHCIYSKPFYASRNEYNEVVEPTAGPDVKDYLIGNSHFLITDKSRTIPIVCHVLYDNCYHDVKLCLFNS